MSKKKRAIEKQKKEQVRKKKKQDKLNRYRKSDWGYKQAKKKEKQQTVWDSQYPGANPDCHLILSKTPSHQNCKGCNLVCPYQPQDVVSSFSED